MRSNNVFPVARQRNVKFVIGSSLNAGFISGSPRYKDVLEHSPPVHREAGEAS
jgi:aryl-alcohol dehydrogenase-like predicted oxidoreductase